MNFKMEICPLIPFSTPCHKTSSVYLVQSLIQCFCILITSVTDKKYLIFINSAWIPEDSIYLYEDNRTKFLLSQRIPRGYKEAIEAIEDALKNRPSEVCNVYNFQQLAHTLYEQRRDLGKVHRALQYILTVIYGTHAYILGLVPWPWVNVPTRACLFFPFCDSGGECLILHAKYSYSIKFADYSVIPKLEKKGQVQKPIYWQ